MIRSSDKTETYENANSFYACHMEWSFCKTKYLATIIWQLYEFFQWSWILKTYTSEKFRLEQRLTDKLQSVLPANDGVAGTLCATSMNHWQWWSLNFKDKPPCICFQSIIQALNSFDSSNWLLVSRSRVLIIMQETGLLEARPSDVVQSLLSYNN